MTKWVILIYEIPNKPSSKRLYIWRKLKKIGALSLQNAVFVLPYTDKTLEQMEWIAAEIVEMNGNANVFISSSTTIRQDDAVREKFINAVTPKYLDVLNDIKAIDFADLHASENALKKCVRDFLNVKYYDYLKCELSVEIETYIEEAQSKLRNLRYGRQDEQ